MTFQWPWPKEVKYSKLQGDRCASEEPKSRVKSARQFMRSHSLEIVVALLLTNAVAVIVLALMGAMWWNATSRTALDSPLPNFPTAPRQFGEDGLFMSRPSPESDAAWEALGGPEREHRGFIRLDVADSYHLGDHANGERMFGLSVFHQLHCLGGIRHMMWDLLHGRADVEHLLAGFPENMTDFTLDATTHGLWHIQHCFDYLRQSLQCSADTSLEWPVEVNGQNLVVGWENYHLCKDWDALYEFAEQNS
ncbi:Cyclochlorotine biosynthesis protein R [Metarhizium anisopliae]|nr:Cyclochlorotine biosynthesis protein R [Metarhizium anisopliae]